LIASNAANGGQNRRENSAIVKREQCYSSEVQIRRIRTVVVAATRRHLDIGSELRRGESGKSRRLLGLSGINRDAMGWAAGLGMVDGDLDFESGVSPPKDPG
jgi:hypothetical protein